MSTIFWDEQEFFNNHLASAMITGHTYDCEFDWQTNRSQITDVSGVSSIPHENALGLSGVLEPLSSADQLTCPSATNTSNQIDIQFFSSFLHQLPLSDNMAYFLQPSLPLHPSDREAATLDKVGTTHIPHWNHAATLPQCHPVQKSTARSLNKRINASRPPTQTTTPRSRYTPYSLGPDSTIRSDLSTSVYRCQWIDSAEPCGAVMAGTKRAIGQHLHSVHGIRLRADKTDQVCLWKDCWKVMRKESISRHVLAVHMHDQVYCPNCRSSFARTDSLQRHQRRCAPKAENASDSF